MTLTASPQVPVTQTPVTQDPATETPTSRTRLGAWFRRRVDAYVANNAAHFGGQADLVPMQLLAVRPSPNFFV